jgi:GT2 family glycosyltransferase
VIPTYGRDEILVDTVAALLRLECRAEELIVVDQTLQHGISVERQLTEWHKGGAIQWHRLACPSTVDAMNVGLHGAGNPLVLFLDDDIVPDRDLVASHVRAHAARPDAWAVSGQIIQPEGVTYDKGPCGARFGLGADLGFRFSALHAEWVFNVMAGNLSVNRDRALSIGGFDRNFTPPVAFRFETEFARRVLSSGGRIWFEPSASIRHLRASSGGTRSHGSHLTSGSPTHGVGDYYFALRCGRGWDRCRYILRRPFREVFTRFHLRHPWWIPVKFAGEIRALALALRLYRKGPQLLSDRVSKDVHS